MRNVLVWIGCCQDAGTKSGLTAEPWAALSLLCRDCGRKWKPLVLRQSRQWRRCALILLMIQTPKVLLNWQSKAISLIYLRFCGGTQKVTTKGDSLCWFFFLPNNCQTFHLNNSFPFLLKCISKLRLLSSTCAQINHLAPVTPRSVWESCSWVTHANTEVWIF